MIDFNRAPYLGTEVEYMQQAIANAKLCGDGPFTKKCSQLMEEQFGTKACSFDDFLHTCPGDGSVSLRSEAGR